jgi:WD40 repeat protein
MAIPEAALPKWSANAHRDRVNHVATSPDRDVFAGSDVSSRVLVWRQGEVALDFTVRSRFRPWLSNVVRALQFSADGRELYVAMSDRVRSYDVENGQTRWCASAPNLLAFLPNPPQGLAVAPSGDLVVTYASGVIDLWTPYRVRKARWSHNDAPRMIGVLGDGRRAIGANGYSVTMWDLDSHALIGRLDPGGHVYGFAVSRVRDVAALHYGTSVRLFDLVEGREMARFDVPPGLPLIAFSPNEEALAVGMGTSVSIRDFEGREIYGTTPSKGRVQAFAFALDGASILVGDSLGGLRAFSPELRLGASQARPRTHRESDQ